MTNKEMECAECFLKWYSSECGVQYLPIRAEKVYPDLEGKPRWDFIALGSSRCHEEEVAIEIKRLTRPHLRIQRGQWERLLARVALKMAPMSGTYLAYTRVLLNPPQDEKYHVFRLDHKRETEFVRTLSGIIRTIGPSMHIKEEADFGPMIMQRFSDWPKHPGKPYEFTLTKWSEGETIVKLGMSCDVFWPDAESAKAMRVLDLATQLGLAKRRGIRQAILLLDCEMDWDPPVIRSLVSGTEVDCAEIDAIYAVETSLQLVSRVWP